MPLAIIPLPDVYETIIRKVAVDAIRQISFNMNIPDTARVYLPGKTESVPMNDGMFGGCNNDKVHFDPEERITITYEELAEENFSLSTAVYNNDNYPLLINEKAYLDIYPITRFVDFRIDIEYQAPSIVIAQRWLDDQRMRYSAGGAEMTLSLTYHYNIPKALLGLLKALYETVQKSPKPSELTFDCWLEQYWTGPTTEMATLIDTNPTLSVYERAVDVVGWFDFYNTPETPRRSDDGTGTYTTEFSFICRYARPTHLKVNYPLLMNNCVIPKLYHPELPYENYQQMDRRTTKFRSSLEKERLDQDRLRLPYINHPDIDNWQPTFNEKDRLDVFVGLIVVCEDSPRTIMNLESLGRYKFNPYWLEAFKLLGNQLIKPNSFMEFSLYKNDRKTDYKLTIDQDTLTLVADRDLDIESYYHVKLAFNTHLESIPRDVWEKIRPFPHYFYDWCRFFGGCNHDICDLDIVGIGRPRPLPGEGSTDYTKDLENVNDEGYIRKDDYYKLAEDHDNINMKPSDIRRIFYLGIISDKRE